MYPYNTRINDEPVSDAKLVISADTQTIADMLVDAINDEAGDYKKYTDLSQSISDAEDSETVKSMSYDEFKHKRIFEEIYHALTGNDAPEANTESWTPGEILIAELTDSLFAELEAVEMYRELMSAFESTMIRDMIFEVITDEQAHADIINYLLAKNRSK